MRIKIVGTDQLIFGDNENRISDTDLLILVIR